MKTMINTVLIIAVLLPITLLFWPFAMWNDTMSLILRIIPSLAVQIFLCRVGKWGILKALPTVLTGALAAWGTYLYFTSPHWIGATVGDLLADYISPFLCCAVVWLTYAVIRKKKNGG